MSVAHLFPRMKSSLNQSDQTFCSVDCDFSRAGSLAVKSAAHTAAELELCLLRYHTSMHS